MDSSPPYRYNPLPGAHPHQATPRPAISRKPCSRPNPKAPKSRPCPAVEILLAELPPGILDRRRHPVYVIEKTHRIWQTLCQGEHYRTLGGKLLHVKGNLVRIPIGRRYRLLCRLQGQELIPLRVLSHEAYNPYARGTHR